MPPLEKHVEKKVCDYAAMLGILQRKFTSPGHTGVPDRIFIIPGGRVAFMELKRPGEKPTALQEREMGLLAKQGASVAWFDNPESACRWLNEILNRKS